MEPFFWRDFSLPVYAEMSSSALSMWDSAAVNLSEKTSIASFIAWLDEATSWSCTERSAFIKRMAAKMSALSCLSRFSAHRVPLAVCRGVLHVSVVVVIAARCRDNLFCFSFLASLFTAWTSNDCWIKLGSRGSNWQNKSAKYSTRDRSSETCCCSGRRHNRKSSTEF